MVRIYQDKTLEAGKIIELDENAVNHILHVLRLSVDDPLIIFNGTGGEFLSHICKIEKHKVFVSINHFSQVENSSQLKIHLAQGISRNEKMDFAIQKSVELGVSCITPVITEYCAVKISNEIFEKRMSHWKKNIISACEQCGLNTIPTINPVMHFHDFVLKSQTELKFILHQGGKNKLSQFTNPKQEIIALVGPEGGFSDAEIQFAVQNNFIDLQMGPRILRTETAALAIISALQSKWGDFF